MSEKIEPNTNDWVVNKGRFFTMWGLPVGLMVIAGLLQLPQLLTGVIWMGALGWMGFACLINARHCGRMHCFFSGPYFLFSAVLALAVGLQLIQPLSLYGLGVFLLIATPLVCVLPEVFWGTYKKPADD